jgi:hypothetical protein
MRTCRESFVPMGVPDDACPCIAAAQTVNARCFAESLTATSWTDGRLWKVRRIYDRRDSRRSPPRARKAARLCAAEPWYPRSPVVTKYGLPSNSIVRWSRHGRYPEIGDARRRQKTGTCGPDRRAVRSNSRSPRSIAHRWVRLERAGGSGGEQEAAQVRHVDLGEALPHRAPLAGRHRHLARDREHRAAGRLGRGRASR